MRNVERRALRYWHVAGGVHQCFRFYYCSCFGLGRRSLFARSGNNKQQQFMYRLLLRLRKMAGVVPHAWYVQTSSAIYSQQIKRSCAVLPWGSLCTSTFSQVYWVGLHVSVAFIAGERLVNPRLLTGRRRLMFCFFYATTFLLVCLCGCYCWSRCWYIYKGAKRRKTCPIATAAVAFHHSDRRKAPGKCISSSSSRAIEEHARARNHRKMFQRLGCDQQMSTTPTFVIANGICQYS